MTFQNTGDVKEGTRKEQEERWKSKVAHGCLQKTLSGDDAIDMRNTNNWLKLHLPAHKEGYTTAIQEQELNTKDTRKSERKTGKEKEYRYIT